MSDPETAKPQFGWQKFTLAAVAVVGLLVVAYLVVTPDGGGTCSAVFEQTAPRLQANLEIIENRGGVAVSREKIQELSVSAQRVGLHLKTCCLVFEAGKLAAAEFQQCVQGASEYDQQIARVAEQVIEVEAASQAGDPGLFQLKASQLNESISDLAQGARWLAGESMMPAAAVRPAGNSGSKAGADNPVTNAEVEPNNDILQATSVAVNSSVDGEIVGPEDTDFLTFAYRGKVRDRVAVTLQNQSTTLRPALKLFDGKKSEFAYLYDGTIGANVNQIFTAVPGSEYYLQVLPWESKGRYSLLIEALHAYDEFEPNDSALSATDIQDRKVLDANIMDSADTDWYRLALVGGEQLILRLENRSTTLRPHIKIYDGNKSELQNNYDGTLGADLDVSLNARSGERYYIQVLPYDSYGDYRLHFK